MTVLTNRGLGSSDVHNRLRIHINEVFSRSCAATVFNSVTGNFNSESVRLGTSVQVFSIESVVTEVVTHIVSDLTGFIPSVVERTCSHTSGINIGNQEDRVGLANVLITRNDRSRVRINSHHSRGNRCRDTTSSRTSHICRVNIILNVVVNSTRSIIDGSSGSTFHQDTVSEPSEDFTINNVCKSCGNRDLTTVTNISVGNFNSSDNRNRIHNNLDGIGGTDTTRSKLVNGQRIVVSAFSRNNRVVQHGSTRDFLTIVTPLEGEHVSIPIIQSSRESDLTTNADVILSSSDIHDRSIINRNLSLCNRLTTIIIDKHHAEAIRIISVRLGKSERVGRSCGNSVVILEPEVGNLGNRSREDISGKNNITFLSNTNDRISNQSDSRVRVDSNVI